MGTDVFVVMGARVHEGGEPSQTLLRRIEGALALAEESPNPTFVACGGIGEHPPAEALVTRDALMARGVRRERILLEPDSHDTLSSVIYCARLLREAGQTGSVTVCSDRFHVLRCALLFRILGVPARPGWIASGRRAFGPGKWLYYWLRDFAGIVWDLPLALLERLRHGGA